jgi:hypothetical protein
MTSDASSGVSAGPRVRAKLPTLRDVGCQAYHDWFGKDVQETPTVSYVWTADQFGHFGLGFQITYLMGWIAILLGHPSKAVLVGCAVANVLVWVVKEAFDYVREVKKAKEAQSIFTLNSGEILWNAVTAVFYIATGAIVAGAAVVGPQWAIVALLVLVLPSAALGVWWLRRKITFQQAGLPYLYRLADFPNDVGGANMAAFIMSLCTPPPAGSTDPGGRHLVISGPLDSGKSSLADGIGTEFAFRMGIGRYTTFAKLLQSRVRREGHREDEPEFNDGRILWPWECSDLLIIDDVEVITDLGRHFAEAAGTTIDPVHQVEVTLKNHMGDHFLKGLNRRRTVWVLGEVPDPVPWRDMLARLMGLTDPKAIGIVSFAQTVKAKMAAQGTPVKPGFCDRGQASYG